MTTTQGPRTHRFTTHNPTDQEIIVLGNMHRQGHMSLIIWASTDAEDWYRHCDPPARCSNKPYRICSDHTWSQGTEANWFAACRKVSGWLAAATRDMGKTAYLTILQSCREKHPQAEETAKSKTRTGNEINEWMKSQTNNRIRCSLIRKYDCA